MTSEVDHECALSRPNELGALSPETDGTQEECRRNASPGECADISSTARLGVAGSSLLTVAGRLKENLCWEMEDGAGGDTTSGCDGDVTSRESCATQRQQQIVAVTRSQYHSIQQLSRPSINHAQTATTSDRLTYSSEMYCQAPQSAPGRYFAKTARLGDEKNSEPECERRWDGDGTAESDGTGVDEGPACTESVDERASDADRRGTNGHGQKTTSAAVSRAWSAEDSIGSTAVEAKRARVEHIVRNMQTPPSCHQTTHQQNLIDGRRQRRKQFAPLQHQHDGPAKRSYVADDDDSDHDVDDTWDSHHLDNSEREALQLGLQRVQDRLADMHKTYMNYLDENSEDDVIVDVGSDVRSEHPIKRLHDDADDAVIGADFNRNEILQRDNDDDAGSRGADSLEALAKMLKAEISDSVGNMVDEIVQSFVARRMKLAQGEGGEWRHGEPNDGRLTPTQRSTMSTTPSPDPHLTARSHTDATAPPPLTPIGTSTAAVDLRFPPVLSAMPLPAAGGLGAMERAAAAAAKLVVGRYSMQSAAAMAAYIDSAFLLHGKTAFEMPPSQSAVSSTSVSPAAAAAAARRLFTPTPFYPAQHAALQRHIVKVKICSFSLSTTYKYF